MSRTFLSQSNNLADLIASIELPSDRALFRELRYLKLEAGFRDRFLIVFRATANIPEVLGVVKILGFTTTEEVGSVCSMELVGTGERITVSHVPTRIFKFDVFVFCPTIQTTRFDARRASEGVVRSLAFPLLIKTKDKGEPYMPGLTYCATPNQFRRWWPKLTAEILHI